MQGRDPHSALKAEVVKKVYAGNLEVVLRAGLANLNSEISGFSA
jgi:hypothetical protein